MRMFIAHWVNSIELEVYILMLNLKITTPSPLGGQYKYYLKSKT